MSTYIDHLIEIKINNCVEFLKSTPIFIHDMFNFEGDLIWNKPIQRKILWNTTRTHRIGQINGKTNTIKLAYEECYDMLKPLKKLGWEIKMIPRDKYWYRRVNILPWWLSCLDDDMDYYGY